MKQLNELYVLLQDSAETYESFIKTEYEKYDAVARDDIKKLDEIIEIEQVFYLKAKGLEQKREKLIQSMGFKGKTLKEIIEKINELETDGNDENHKLKNVYDRLFKALNDFKKINLECKTLIGVRMHRIENAMSKLGEKENIYSNLENNKSYLKSHIVSKKI